MSDSVHRREAKRHQTARRLRQCAVELTLDRGFDGWTIDDLAAEAEVSRRTVFNYFDGKVEVVLGPVVEHDPERIAVFVAGGPSGHLFEDVLTVSADVIDEHAEDLELLPAWRRAVMADTRLIATVHERFESISETFVEHILAREGKEYGAARARLITRLVVTLFDAALERAEGDPTVPFAEHFAGAVTDARSVLAPPTP